MFERLFLRDMLDDGDEDQYRIGSAKEEGDTNYAECSRYGGSLFSKDPHDKDDEDVTDEVKNKRMDERRKEDRENRFRKEFKCYHQECSPIQEFLDLKRELVNVIKDQQTNNTNENFDFIKIGQLRNTLTNVKLNQVSESVKDQTVVDPKRYFTDLQSMKPTYGGNNDQSNRLLLESARKTNPKCPPEWIESAKWEELLGNIEEARDLLMKGCEENPTSEDLWLEAARLQPPDKAKAVIRDSMRHIPTSVRIWIKAADLETNLRKKRRIYEEALEHIPNSVRLWKAAVELEEPEDAYILLSSAVKRCPTSVDLWLDLARLETSENRKRTLCKAKDNIPTYKSGPIWIALAKLEEENGNKDKAERIIDYAISLLRENKVDLNKKDWYKEAMEAEKAKAVHCCQVIVKAIIGFDVKEENKEHIWMKDAETVRLLLNCYCYCCCCCCRYCFY